MIKEIIHDQMFLAKKSVPCTKDDIPLGIDLLDTLTYNKERCVGMAANMIGISKSAIVFFDGSKNVVMFNPLIIEKHNPYDTDEGCLSLSGTRKTTRFMFIKVSYKDMSFSSKTASFSGFVAEIIQHEIDHTLGIII